VSNVRISQYLHDFTQFFLRLSFLETQELGDICTDDNQTFLIESGYGVLMSESSTALREPCRGGKAIGPKVGELHGII
jgi:hypothetical protein